MPLILGSNAPTGGYEVDNSLRFDDGSSDYLNRTPASSGNRKTFTLSFWAKITESAFSYFSGQISGSNYGQIGLTSTGSIRFFQNSPSVNVETNQVLRDPSAWYHIVYSVDTTQATAADRIKIYVNGTEATYASTTYPSLNADMNYNQGSVSQGIGARGNGEGFFDGYMSEVVFIDGQALDETSFGEFDEDSGIWKPIDVSGLTFGTNGFYLEFKDSSALGDDTSGNSNDFTVNNLTSIDQTTDTPTNNFATWNSLIKTAATFSNGNTSLNNTSSPYKGSMATIVPTQGKWYAEIKAIDATTAMIGFITADTLIDGDRSLYDSSSNIYWQTNVTTIRYYLNSVLQGNATVTGGTNSVPTYTNNDIIMLAMDLDNGYGWFGKNGTWQNSGDPAGGTNAFNLASDYANGTTIYSGNLNANIAANFGNPSFTISSGNSDANGYGNFEYAVPSGYYALNTKNLAEYG